MSSVARFNPQSQSYVTQGADGKFESLPVRRQGLVQNTPAPQPGPAVLSSGMAATLQSPVKIIS